MRSSVAPLLAVGLLALGCAKPNSAGDPGTGGSSSPGNGGSSGPGTGGSSGGGTTGGPPCVSDPTNLVRAGGWICDLAQPYMIQGSWYSYGDSTAAMNSMCKPPSGNPCTAANGCCTMGATIVDSTYAAWGCGIGMELSSSGGTTPVKSVYTGSAKCFNITLTGNSGGNPVRIGFSQSPTPASNAVAPFKEIPMFTNGWSGQVCFADVTCPSWAVTAGTCTKGAGDGTPVDMQLQIPGGDRAGAFNVCITKVEPVVSGGPGTGGTGGGGVVSCTQPSGAGTITDQFGAMHVACPKDYVVQNNAWGSAAGQSIDFGPGTKFKVTRQNETRTNDTTPAGYPSIFTGVTTGDAGRTTANSGLPRAIAQIGAGSIQTSFTWADNGATGSYNAAYDVWFSTTSAGDASTSAPSGGFLMVWFNDSPLNQPIGQQLASVTIGGKQFTVWYGTNMSRPVVSYVAQQNFFSWTFSLGDFIQDAATRNCQGTNKCLNPQWYLAKVFAGFEIWYGGVGLEVKDFGVTVP